MIVSASDPINFRHPLNRGLVGAWLGPWQKPGGNKAIDGCGFSDGTLTAMDPAIDWVRGPFRGKHALDFGGSDDRVLIPNVVQQDALTEFTFLAWANPVLVGSFPSLLTRLPSGTERVEWGLRGAQSYVPYLLDDDQISQGNTAPAAGVWSYLAVTTNAAATTHYLNGNAIGGDDPAGEGIVGGSWAIGNRPDGSRPFGGQISEMRIYNRVLSAAEIYQLYRLTQLEQSALYNYQLTTTTEDQLLLEEEAGDGDFDGRLPKMIYGRFRKIKSTNTTISDANIIGFRG